MRFQVLFILVLQVECDDNKEFLTFFLACFCDRLPTDGELEAGLSQL